MPDLLIASTGLILAALALVVVFVLSRRQQAQLQQMRDELQASLQALHQQQTLQQQSISGLTAGAVGMDRRMSRSEAAGRLMDERQQTFENQQAADQPYSQAIRLVQQGASERRLVEELGLSESEADLIVRLHGLRNSA